jgi:hypothetical protein
MHSPPQPRKGEIRSVGAWFPTVRHPTWPLSNSKKRRLACLSEALLWSEKMRSSDQSMANATSQTQQDFAKVLKDQHDESANELRKVNALFVSNMMEDKEAARSHMLKMMATALKKQRRYRNAEASED